MQRKRTAPPVQEPHEIPWLRRLLGASLFYLPLAGLVAGFLSWAILEPHLEDFARVTGEVVLVENDPLTPELAGLGELVSFTVGNAEVVCVLGWAVFEPGPDGQAPFASEADIEIGTVLEAVGEPLSSDRMLAVALRPVAFGSIDVDDVSMQKPSQIVAFFTFIITSALIAGALLFAEGLSSRNWTRMFQRMGLGTLLTAIFSFLAYLPASLAMLLAIMTSPDIAGTPADYPLPAFLFFMACRSVAWSCIGASLGLGMNLIRGAKVELRNSVVGGALGGALGGAFFEPLERFGRASVFDEAWLPRLIGLMLLGLCVGFFVALVDRLAREAWIIIRTGPLLGKAFVLYKTPTVIGSAPAADLYLFKDAEIDPAHAQIHRVGDRYEIEDMGSRSGTRVGGRPVTSARLHSGDTVVVGATILEFEERAEKQTRAETHGRTTSGVL